MLSDTDVSEDYDHDQLYQAIGSNDLEYRLSQDSNENQD